jgi:serine/threonine protein kinase
MGQDGDLSDLPRHIILNRGEPDPYEFRRELGAGNMGYVDMVESLASGSICVRKTMRIPAARRQQFTDVVLLMEQLKHEHIVEILGSYSISPNSFILMKPVADWDLKKYMNSEDGAVADASNLTQWLGCLAHGLAYIHGKQVKHKDIKPSNLLVHGDNILYTDFDLAHAFKSPGDVTKGPTGQSVPYSAPEVVNGGDRTPTTDVFSLGCVYVEMLTVISGMKVWDIFQKSPEEPEYNYRGPNEAKAVEWLQHLSFSDKEKECGEVVRLTKRMISQERPDAVVLSDDLAFLACHSCLSQ